MSQTSLTKRVYSPKLVRNSSPRSGSISPRSGSKGRGMSFKPSALERNHKLASQINLIEELNA